ncbi:MAG: hypothetical protein H5U30_12375, partial [Marinobacter sp.]|nr:hypothetical protein [Marinobacter sp.]
MSLLTSLIRASTQFQQAMEKRQASATGADASANTAQSRPADVEPTAGDDRFTPSENSNADLARLK